MSDRRRTSSRWATIRLTVAGAAFACVLAGPAGSAHATGNGTPDPIRANTVPPICGYCWNPG